MRHIIAFLLVSTIVALSLPSEARRQAETQPPGLPSFKERAIDASFESGSPDGKLVVYHRGAAAGRVYARDLAAGEERVLVDLDGDASHFAWSPDSRRLALTFTSRAPQKTEIRIITVATGASRTLDASGSVMAWTTKNEIFFTAPAPFGPAGAFLVPVRGGTPVRILWGPTGSPEAITPDGSALVIRQGQRLLLHDLTTHVERTITADTAPKGSFLISPDGRLLAFVSYQGGESALYVAPLDPLPARNPIRVASFDGRASEPVGWWTSAGQLTLTGLTYPEQNIFRVNMNAGTGRASGPAQRLTQGALEHDDLAVSLDGAHIAHWYGVQNRQGFGVVDSRGGGEQRVVERASSAPKLFPFAWRSPTEVLIYDGAGASPGIFAADIQTGAQQQLAPVDDSRSSAPPEYLPARQEIHVSGSAGTTGNLLKTRSLGGGAGRVVATMDYLQDFAVSADGRHVAYVTRSGPGAADAGSEMGLITTDGAFERVLLTTEPGVPVAVSAWSPDGKYLLYYRSGPRVIDVTSLESWPLMTSAADRAIDWSSYRNGRWAPDGSFIVMTGDELRPAPVGQAWEGVTAAAVSKLMAGHLGR